MDYRPFLLTPAELAARYGFDADRLMDAIHPETFEGNDRLEALVFEALALCHDARLDR